MSARILIIRAALAGALGLVAGCGDNSASPPSSAAKPTDTLQVQPFPTGPGVAPPPAAAAAAPVTALAPGEPTPTPTPPPPTEPPTEPVNPTAPLGEAPAAAVATPSAEAAPNPPPSSGQPTGGPAVVALLVPLTGRDAGLGGALLDAAELAVFDFAGDGFELRPYDTGAEGGAGAAATNALADGAALILGPVFNRQVAEVAAVAVPRQVPVISFSSDRAVAAQGVFLMGLPPGDALREVIAYARAQGRSRFAALLPRNELGERLAAVVRSVGESGATVAHVDTYDPATVDFQETVKTVAEFDQRRANVAFTADASRTNDQKRRAARLKTNRDPSYDALVLAEGGERLKSLAALLPYFDVDNPTVKLLGPPSWEDPTLGTEPALIGGWFAAPDPAGRATFTDRFKAATGHAAPRIAPLGYDAVGLAAVLARLGGTAYFSSAALSNPSGFAGVDGIFRFGADGVIQRGLAIFEVARAGDTLIRPAPTSFQAPDAAAVPTQ